MRLGREQGNEQEMELPASKQLIAPFLGIRSESLSRALFDLQPIGVTVEGERVRIADPLALTPFAQIDQDIDNSAT